MDSNKTVYISIGSDCAVAHNLRKLNLVDVAYPFDWIKCDSKSICETLDNDFSNFFENYTIKHQSDNFDNFDEGGKSLVKIILKNKMILPHEAQEMEFNFDSYKEKYKRRINRFKNIIRDCTIKKIFVRADNSPIDLEKEKLESSLEKYGAINFNIRFINYNDYTCEEEFTWQRNYIDWKKILIFP